MTEQIPSDDLVHIVITDGDGPLETGELLTCAKLGQNELGREIGFPGRKPIKWECEYKRFETLGAAIKRACELEPLGGIPNSLERSEL